MAENPGSVSSVADSGSRNNTGSSTADAQAFNRALEQAGAGNANATGSQGWGATLSNVQDSAAGRIVEKAADGFQEGWGNRQLGLGPETVQSLRDWNIFSNPNYSHTVFHNINEALIGGSAVAIDGVARGITSFIHGTANALGQTNDELGGTEGSRLARDLKAMPDAFAGMGRLLTGGSRITTALRSNQITEDARVTAQIARQNFDDAINQAGQYELRFDRSTIGTAGGNVSIAKKTPDVSAAELAKARGWPTDHQLPPHHYWSSRNQIDPVTGETRQELFLQRTDATKVDLHRYNPEAQKFELIPGTRILPENSSDLSRVGPFKPVNLDDIRSMNVYGTSAKRIREGWNDEIAVIGRNMHGRDGVVGFTKELNQRGYKTHLFAGDVISPASRSEWELLQLEFKANGGLIPQYRLFGTLGHRENVAWAQRMVDEGYTVVDIGNPNNKGFSVYYAEEKRIIFGGRSDR